MIVKPCRVVAVCLLVAGCARYDPPVAGDHSSPKYAADLVKCRKQAALLASKKANATPQSAVMAVFDSGDAERTNVLTCMQGRGYPAQAPQS